MRLVSQAEKEQSERKFIDTTRKIQLGEVGVETPTELACNTLLANTCLLTGPDSGKSDFLTKDDPTAEDAGRGAKVGKGLSVIQLNLF